MEVDLSSLGITELQTLAKSIRRDIVSMTAEANSGHCGGSLSSVEILTALYFNVLRIDPDNPSWAERDRFVESKAHACPVLYSVLARRGFFPVEELMTFRKINSRLQGHAHVKTPGVEMSGGSLGQGLSFGLGAAIAGRLDRRDTKVYVLLGDGELEEGQIWEAAMAAPFYQLGSLTAIVDRNRIQNDRFTSEVMGLEPLADRWQSFGWETIEIDGHDFPQVISALEKSQISSEKPTVIIANTIKGKGISFMENNPEFHGKPPNPEQLVQALKELQDEN
jgi:transketolase